jgi:hypothetical protein
VLISKNFIVRPRLLFEKPLFLIDEILGFSNVTISFILMAYRSRSAGACAACRSGLKVQSLRVVNSEL